MGFGDFIKTLGSVAQAAAPFVGMENPTAGAALSVGGGLTSGNTQGIAGTAGPLLAGSLDSSNNQYIGQAQDLQLQAMKLGIDNAYAQALAKHNAAGAGGAASAGNARAAAAFAAARGAAAKQEEHNRMAAAKKAYHSQQKMYGDAMGLLQPYQDAGKAVLPAMTSAYNSGAANLGLLSSQVNAPDARVRLDQGRPAFQVNVPLPPWVGH